MDHRNRKDAAKAARDDVYPTLAQAAELLRQGSLLAQARSNSARWHELLQRFNVTEDFANSLILLVTAGASAGLIAHNGINTTVKAADRGLTLAPGSEITFVESTIDGAEVIELFVPWRAAGDAPITYYARSSIGGQAVAQSMLRLTKPIHIGLASIAASEESFPSWGQYDKDETGKNWLHHVRAQIGRMKSQGLRFDGGAA